MLPPRRWAVVVLSTVFLTRRHVSHLQDEGGQAGLGLAARMLRSGERREVGGNQTKTNQGKGEKKASYTPYRGERRKAATNCCQQLSGCTISLPYGPISTLELRFLAQQLHTNRIPSISSYIFRHVWVWLLVCCFFFLLKFPLPFSLMGITHPSCRDQVQQKAS